MEHADLAEKVPWHELASQIAVDVDPCLTVEQHIKGIARLSLRGQDLSGRRVHLIGSAGDELQLMLGERRKQRDLAECLDLGIVHRPAAYPADVVTACSVCGRPLPDAARFCPNCGASVGALAGTEERKMITVLFADIVDSTGLAARLDAERAREVLGQFFGAAAEELIALRGRPEKFIGDAVMAVFGLPTVHEDDALRAVRAGLAIRARTHRLVAAAGLSPPLDVRVGFEIGEAATGPKPI